MTTDEILTAKSDEIKRLHRVCNSKDQVIQNAINAFEELKRSFHCDTWKFVDDMIDELKSTIG